MPVSPILLAGPTASGKSLLAIELAERLDGVIINADSMQVYRELRLITARPTPAEEDQVPHELYGMVSAAEPFSVARWHDRAIAEVDAAAAIRRVPIVVGGTGLYFRALLRGLAPIPEIPEAIRLQVRHRFDCLGAEAFRAQLAERDPVMAARLATGDRHRLIRAAEVLEGTGTPLSTWHKRGDAGGLKTPPRVRILMMPARERLYERCDHRFREIMAKGALDEAAAFDGLGLDPGLPATKAVGLRPLLRHVRGEITLKDAIAAGRQAVRHYAKRQYTWFRHQAADWQILDDLLPGQGADRLVAIIRASLSRTF